MTTYEFLEIFALSKSQQISLLQWWASISFGLIALSHIGRKQLNLSLVILIVLLYIGFSLAMLAIFFDEIAISNKIVLLLKDMESTNEPGKEFIDFMNNKGFPLWGVFGLTISFIGTFIGSIFYVLYAYKSNKK